MAVSSTAPTGQATYPLHNNVLHSDAVKRTFSGFGSYLLPQAFPEGCPQFPAYPSGYATMAGACATLLKATFDGSVPFASLTKGKIAVASSDGLSLEDYTGADAGQITLNGEINKLASNIAFSRNMSGIHWRVDAVYGMLLGEALALSILADQSNNYPGENFEALQSRNSTERRFLSDPTSAVLSKSAGESRGNTGDTTGHAELWC